MNPEQQTKIFSTAQHKGLQNLGKNNIPTWQWFQNSKVLKIWILKIEKEKISFVQYLGCNVSVLNFNWSGTVIHTFLRIMTCLYKKFKSYGNTVIINADSIDTIVQSSYSISTLVKISSISLTVSWVRVKKNYADPGMQEHYTVNPKTFEYRHIK